MKKFVAPDIDLDTATYWQGLCENTLKLQHCGDCGQHRFPPLPSCPHCGELGGQWKTVSGRGSLHTWSVVYHPLDPRLKEEVPFILTLVELEEGPRISGRLVGADPDQLKIGMPVTARFDELDEALTLVNFELAS